jgi:hypothetical protein
VFDCAVDEIRAELLLTRRGAQRELERAVAVCAQPRVWAALSRGELDRARALVLAEGCHDLSAEQAAMLLDRLLPEAGTRTVTGLAERVRRVAVALDPAWAERRYREAVRERRVIGYLNEDGTATVSGQHLPAQAAAAACERVDTLAAAAKRAGANAPIDHLRAELFLALLDGRYQQLSTDQIIAALRAHFPAHPDTAAGAQPAPTLGSPRAVALKVGLATLLDLDEQPGEIAGWGPVPATVARDVAARQHRTQWRFAILDAPGRLLSEGTTRSRPRPLRDPVQAEGGSIELHAPAALLDQPGLAATHPAWAKLLADLTAQRADPRPIEQDPAARFAGRRLRRRIQIINQHCVFPGCRRPSADCDLDHRHDHAHGGTTEQANLSPACRHDHLNKTRRNWRLVQLNQHTYCWISPLGRRHIVHIDPIAAPLPAPIPRTLRPDIALPDFDHTGPSFQHHTRHGRPRKTPTMRTSTADDGPPF